MYTYNRGHIGLEKGVYTKDTLDEIISEVKESEGPAYESALDIARLSGMDVDRMSDTNEYGLDLKVTDNLCNALLGEVRLGEVDGRICYLHMDDVIGRRVCGLEAIASKMSFADKLGLGKVS